MRGHRLWLCLLGVLLLPGLAQAHTVGAGDNAFWTGLAHLLTAPEHVLLLLAAGLLAGQQGTAQAGRLRWLMALGLLTGALLPVTGLPLPHLPLVTLLTVIPVSLLVVLGRSWPVPVVAAVLLLAAVPHGYAHGAAFVGTLPDYLLFIGGAAVATFAVLFYGSGLVLGLKPFWTRIAVRVAGSWIAAISILVLGRYLAQAH